MLNPGGNNREDIRCALSWVHHLFELFGLDPSDPTITEALVNRYASQSEVGSKDEDDDGSQRDHSKDRFWCSMRICDSSSPDARQQYTLHCAKSTVEEQCTLLLDRDGHPFAQAPPETSVGDFYIEVDRWETIPSSWSNLGIIVKGQSKLYQRQNTHSLLGLARRFPSQTGVAKRAYYSGEHEKFNFAQLFWDVNDIFLLYLSTLYQAHFSIENLVRIRICDPEREFSSFARFW